MKGGGDCAVVSTVSEVLLAGGPMVGDDTTTTGFEVVACDGLYVNVLERSVPIDPLCVGDESEDE